MPFQKFKNLFNHFPRVKELLKTFLKPFRRNTLAVDPPSVWLKNLMSLHEESIIQIGSNDGKQGDPIYELIQNNPGWKAVFVEPIPYLFNRLQNNYGNSPRFTFVNAAINNGSEQIFYSVKEEAKKELPDLPFWFDQLGSFNKSNITKHLNGKLTPYITETKLKGITLNQLISQNSTLPISLLHIDTEGYDWEILSQLDLNKNYPHIILYEHKHLTNKDREKSISFLTKRYALFQLRGDIIAISKNRFKRNQYAQLSGYKLN